MKKKIFTRSASAFLLFVLCASLFFVFAHANGNDYSYASATEIETVHADTFLEKELGITLIDEEKAYLRHQSGFALIYNSNIPTSYIDVIYNETGHSLTVQAREYVYTAKNGVSVVWKPISATLSSVTKEFSGEDYILEFDTLGIREESVDVKYEKEFIISKETANTLLNLAYINAPILEEELAKKEAEYLENTLKYNTYLSMLEAYNEYIIEKRIYDQKYAEYSAYLSELLEYQEDYREYQAYLAAKEKYEKDYAKYLKYLAYAESNQSKIEAYEKYQEKIDTVRAQLSIITATKTSVTSLKRTIYAAIMGNTVTSVIENKDLIANGITGASPEAIDRAGIATENLRALMTDFFDITGEKARYNYYITNYEAFRDNFAELLACLDKLYMNSKVRGILISQEKQEKYVILLAQLYYISNALSDGPVRNYDKTGYFDENYIIGKGYIDEKKPSSVITEKGYLVDTGNAAPLSDGYPIAPPAPEYTTMQEPVAPVKIKEPIAPEAVSEPVCPEVVEKPTEVKNPGEKYIPPSEVTDIIEAYNKGLLSERSEISEDITVLREITVVKRFINAEQVTVIYYDSEYSAEKTPNELYRITVDKGSFADYMGVVPTKEEDDFYTYEHSGWTDSSGNDVNLSAVTSSMSVFPKFDSIEKPYRTYYVVEGVTYVEEVKNPWKAVQGDYCYEFIGWDKKVDSETLDITYTALFEEKYLVPLSTGGATVTLSGDTYTVNTGANYSMIDVSMLVKAVAGHGDVVLESISGKISISYSELIAMKNAGVCSLDLSVKKHTGKGYSYVVELYGENDEKILSPIKLNFVLPCDVPSDEHLIVYFNEENGQRVVKSTYSDIDKTVSFTGMSGITYYARLEYTLTILSLDGIGIEVNKTIFEENEDVSITLNVDGGIRIDRLYVIYPDGTKRDVELSFKMPAENLVLGIDYTVLEYTVTFVSDGKTIVSYICHYGDEVEVPADPQKASDQNFKYTFIGWSEKVVPVTESVVYTAVYQRVALPKEDKDGLQIDSEILKLILLLGSLSITVVLIVIPSSIMTSIMLFKRRKRFIRSKRVKK